MSSFKKAVELIEENDIEGFKKLITKKSFLLYMSGKYGETLLHIAAINRNIEIARFLLDYGVDINSRDEKRMTALYIAILNSDREMTEFLLDHAADVNIKTAEGQSVIHIAVNQKDIDIVRLLIDYGADVNSRDIDDWTVLHWAAREGNIDIAKLLIDLEADVNSRNRTTRQTPLHIAAEQKRIDITKLLILHGANPYIKDVFEKTPLSYIEDEKIKHKLLFIYHNREKILKEIDRQKEIEYN